MSRRDQQSMAAIAGGVMLACWIILMMLIIGRIFGL